MDVHPLQRLFTDPVENMEVVAQFITTLHMDSYALNNVVTKFVTPVQAVYLLNYWRQIIALPSYDIFHARDHEWASELAGIAVLHKVSPQRGELDLLLVGSKWIGTLDVMKVVLGQLERHAKSIGIIYLVAEAEAERTDCHGANTYIELGYQKLGDIPEWGSYIETETQIARGMSEISDITCVSCMCGIREVVPTNPGSGMTRDGVLLIKNLSTADPL